MLEACRALPVLAQGIQPRGIRGEFGSDHGDEHNPVQGGLPRLVGKAVLSLGDLLQVLESADPDLVHAPLPRPRPAPVPGRANLLPRSAPERQGF